MGLNDLLSFNYYFVILSSTKHTNYFLCLLSAPPPSDQPTRPTTYNCLLSYAPVPLLSFNKINVRNILQKYEAFFCLLTKLKTCHVPAKSDIVYFLLHKMD